MGRTQIKKTIPGILVAKRSSLEGYKLHSGKGDRQFTQTIRFEKTFSSPPNVFAAFCQLDVVNKTDHRYL